MKKNKNDKKKLIIVSNRLPFYKTIDQYGKEVWRQATGGLITALDPVLRKTHGIWLGWDGSSPQNINPDKLELVDIRNIQTNAQAFSTTEGYYFVGNIPISDNEVEQYYNRFSNGTLWALFHYFFEKASIDYAAWKTYYEINFRFAQHIYKTASTNDIVWVQDFHLFLVPYFLRKMRPNQEIHFFLHTPFPHFDIFSIIPWQNQILESLLCCNTVAFHHKQYLRNAIEAVKIYKKHKRDFGEETLEDSVETRFFINPISIDFDRFNNTALLPEVIQKKEIIREQCGCPKLILGVDRLDYSKGILQRLLGLEVFFEKHPEMKGLVSYYQLSVPSREDVDAYKTLKKQIDELIGRINGRFSTPTWSPIHYMYNAVQFDKLVALYSAADIALVTPLRDGMNLVCKEYIASHPDNRGVLILSKFAGAISEIRNCLSVNPYSIEDIASTLYKAVHLTEQEQKRRMVRMRRNISANNIKRWLDRNLEEFSLESFHM